MQEEEGADSAKKEEAAPRSWALVAPAVVLLALALVLGAGGVWLLVLNDSPYYAAAALVLAAVALLLLVRHPLALWLYALFLLGTLAWALWESGLDWWPLAARLDVFFLLGAWLLLPAVGGRLQRGWFNGRGAMAAALALFAVVAAASWVYDPHDVRGRASVAAAGSPASAPASAAVPAGDWHAYGRTGFGQRYAPLDQVNASNVGQLEEAWHFRTGDVPGRPGDPHETTFEATPLKVGNRLFLCTPHQSVIALDATTGQALWRHDAQVAGKLALQHLTCRGVSYQPPPTGDAQCPSRIFMPTADGRLLALNADTGQPCLAFGGKGAIDLWAGMPNHKPGAYYSTSPVVVARGLVIVGGTVLDNVSVNEQSGVIRAFDAGDGHLVWNWDSGRPDVTSPLPAGQTYVPNSPNSWSVSAVDEELGMVYVPLGNQPPDQWGGNRSEAVEKYASSVVALDLATGAVRWSFQTVHHDLWDYDVPSQPSLLDLTVNGTVVPALVQPTKQGELFVLDRRTGTPILPVEEQPAPQGAAPGDRTAPAQPRSALSFAPPPLSGADMWGTTIVDQLYCRIAFKRLRYEGRFTPPSLRGTLVYPGNFGVFNWGSIAVDPVRGTAFTTPAYLAFVSKLVPRTDATSLLVQGKEKQPESLPSLNENFGAPYAVKLNAFVSPLGIPCQRPPWGYVAGVDLATGRIAWRHRNGTVRDLAPLPIPFRMGVPSLGGPILTAGNLAFLSGTLDYYVRAYDASTGDVLWRSRLPAGGQATPMTYLGADGRQYVVVVAGGHGSLGTRVGDHVIAYALPKR